jgi:hypothetical protein
MAYIFFNAVIIITPLACLPLSIFYTLLCDEAVNPLNGSSRMYILALEHKTLASDSILS